MYSYLLINCASIAIPLLLSFEKRVHYFKKWKYLFPAIAGMGIPFIIWDYFFTKWGVWGFNPDYLSGQYLLNLPLEEWLFFFCIPYSCLFIYEVLNYFIPRQILPNYGKKISIGLVVVLLLFAGIYHDRYYTFTTFLGTSILLIYILINGKNAYLGKFYLMYLISLFPFFIVNGLLTGTALAEPIVWYNDVENMGIRLGTIPLEDTVYSLFMLLLTTHIYERLKASL